MQLFKVYVKNLSFQRLLAGDFWFELLTFCLRKDFQDPYQIRFAILKGWGRFHWNGSRSTRITGNRSTCMIGSRSICVITWPLERSVSKAEVTWQQSSRTSPWSVRLPLPRLIKSGFHLEPRVPFLTYALDRSSTHALDPSPSTP